MGLGNSQPRIQRLPWTMLSSPAVWFSWLILIWSLQLGTDPIRRQFEQGYHDISILILPIHRKMVKESFLGMWAFEFGLLNKYLKANADSYSHSAQLETISARVCKIIFYFHIWHRFVHKIRLLKEPADGLTLLMHSVFYIQCIILIVIFFGFSLYFSPSNFLGYIHLAIHSTNC